MVFKLTEQNYQYLFENASDAMWVHDLQGNILVANRACETLTGYTREELSRMNVAQFLTEEFLDSARQVKATLLSGEATNMLYEQRLLRKDGSTGVVKMSTSLVQIGDDVDGFQNIARDITREKQMQENLSYYVEQITRAQEDERRRVARQLHDDVAPLILLMIQALDAIESGTRPKLSAALTGKLEEVRERGVEALEGVRRCAQNLRPSIVDDLGLKAALEWMAEDLQKSTGIEARVEFVEESFEPTPEQQLLLFRIAQEALSNIRRHAAGATRAEVRLEKGETRIRLTITDNGRGFEVGEGDGFVGTGKLGIAGMHERARLLGGQLTINSAAGKGTQVLADIPLTQSL